MTINDKIKYLSAPLPEDIQSYISSGYYDRAISLIDSRLSSGCPEALQGRLELEKVRLIHLPADFPYTYPQALALIRNTIPTFTEEEFQALETAGRIDFLFLNGEKRYFHRFFETLTATHRSPFQSGPGGRIRPQGRVPVENHPSDQRKRGTPVSHPYPGRS